MPLRNIGNIAKIRGIEVELFPGEIKPTDSWKELFIFTVLRGNPSPVSTCRAKGAPSETVEEKVGEVIKYWQEASPMGPPWFTKLRVVVNQGEEWSTPEPWAVARKLGAIKSIPANKGKLFETISTPVLTMLR